MRSDSHNVGDTSNVVIALNCAIEKAVVAKDFPLLTSAYAEEFVFTHGTGLVQSKNEWLESLREPSSRFVSREPEQTSVEFQDHSAIVSGSILIHRESANGNSKYGIRYVRVFSDVTGAWQLVSHKTTEQWEL